MPRKRKAKGHWFVARWKSDGIVLVASGMSVEQAREKWEMMTITNRGWLGLGRSFLRQKAFGMIGVVEVVHDRSKGWAERLIPR